MYEVTKVKDEATPEGHGIKRKFDMRHAIAAVILCSAVLCAASCAGGHRNGTGTTSVSEATPTLKQEDAVRPYRFLDFRHDGTREGFIREARKSGFFVLQNSSNVVRFLGSDWGLNIHTDSLDRVSEVILITSNTSSEVFRNACEALPKYFGEPWETDYAEERVKWSTFYCHAHLRHLHTPEGGWTMIMDLSYPEPMEDDLNEYQLRAVREFQEDVRSGDRERIAAHFSFPFELGYPLPEIRDRDDFLARYDLLFDKDIEEEIASTRAWDEIGWRGIACNNGWMLWGDTYENKFIVSSFNTHTDAYMKALQEEVDRQRERVHPSLRDYDRPLVVARTDTLIFRVDRMRQGGLRLAFWKDGKSMTDRPDYVNNDGFRSQEGSLGYPDWLFVSGKDTVNVGFMSTDKDYFFLYRYSGDKTLMSVETTDFEN